MKLTDRLYESVKPIWDGYNTHPFVAGIANGSLPLEKFRYYMLQDYLYLYDYAKVFALGVVKSTDHDLMRLFAKLVDATLDGEMTIHHTYMARLGITKEEVALAKPALSNVSYCKYMLEVGYSQGILELLTAILACSWSYALIGQHAAKVPGAVDHEFYGDWIKGYASDDYQASNQQLLDIIDKLGENITDAQYENLKTIFINCSRYEAMFWDMADSMAD